MALTPSLGAGFDGKMAIDLSDSIQTITSPVQSILGGDLVLIGWRKEMLSWTWTGCQPGCCRLQHCGLDQTKTTGTSLSCVSCCTQRLQLGSAEHCGSVREAQRTKEHTGTTSQAGCRKAALPPPSPPVHPPCCSRFLAQPSSWSWAAWAGPR